MSTTIRQTLWQRARSDQFGYAFRTGANEFRIELPAPRYESKLDILEFRR